MNTNDGPLNFEATLETRQFNRNLTETERRIAGLSKSTAAEADAMTKSFKKVTAAAGTLLSIEFARRIIGEVSQVRGEFQKFEAVLTNTLNGDNIKASKLLEGISDFAAKTPYQLDDITENFVKLANQGVILNQQELKKLGDFAAVTGKSIGQLFEAILDINNPERWKEFGTKIQTEGEKVMITFRGQQVEFERTIEGAKNAIAQLGSMEGVAGTMSAISETIEGQVSNLEDAWKKMLNEWGKDSEDLISGVISGTTSLIENHKTVIDTLKAVAATYGTAKAAAIVYNLVMKEQGAVNAMVAASNNVFSKTLARQWLWTERMQKMQALLNKTMLVNPYVLATAAITGLIAGLFLLDQRFEESIDAKKNFDKHMAEANDVYNNRIDKGNSLIQTLKSETEAEVKRLDALNQLKEMYPNVFGEMDIHSAKLKDLQTETKKLNEEESKLSLERQKEYIRQLAVQRDELEKSIDSSSTNVVSSGMYASYDPTGQISREKDKLDQLNRQIELENDKYNEMLIAQIDAQQSAREESEKTIQQRIKEANSIESLGKLRDEWEAKWKTATTESERERFKSEFDLVDSVLEKMKAGKNLIPSVIAEAKARLKELNEQLGQSPESDVEIHLKIANEQAFIDEFQEKVRDKLAEKLNTETPDKLTTIPIGFSIGDNLAKNTPNATLELEKIQKEIDKATVKYKKWIKELNSEKLQTFLNELYKIGYFASEIGKEFESWGGPIGDFGKMLSGATGEMNNFLTVLDDTASKGERISAGVDGVVSLIGTVVKSAKERHDIEQQYYDSLIDQQQEYNLLLNDQIRIQSEITDNVFVTDYQGRLTDSIAAFSDANDHYNDSLKELAEGQAILGKRNAIDWANVGTGVGSGAVAGAAIGSVIPVIGTAVGAIVGGLVGGLTGLFGGKKKEDVLGSLIGEYPELITESKDGQKELNVELAQTLINQELVNEETAKALQNAIDWKEKMDEAQAQLEETIETLAGSLGDDLSNALVDAFENGTDAAKAFGDSVGDILENIIKQMIFQQIFGNLFTELQDRMEASFGVNGDQSWTDDFGWFFKQTPDLISEGLQALEDAKAEAAAYGLDIFGDQSTTQTGLTGAISRSITEETAGELAGIWRKTSDDTREIRDYTRESIEFLSRIDTNTAETVKELINQTGEIRNSVIELQTANKELATIAKNTEPVQTGRDLGV